MGNGGFLLGRGMIGCTKDSGYDYIWDGSWVLVKNQQKFEKVAKERLMEMDFDNFCERMTLLDLI